MPLPINALFLAQASPTTAPGAPAPGGSPLMTFLPMLFILGALYFLMIAPQRKKQKQHEAMLKELKTGDDVLTSAGIFGTITNVKDDRFVIRIADTTKVEIAKGFIQSVIPKPGEETRK